MKVGELYKKLDEKFPFDLQCEWDNSGFLCGELEDEVEKVLVTLDVNLEVCENAVLLGCNVILSHHPLMFGKGINSIVDSKDAKILKYCIKNNLNIIAMHTNLDNSDAYVSKAIALKLGYEVTHTFSLGEDVIGVEVDINQDTVDVVNHIKHVFNYRALKCSLNNSKVKKALIIGGSGNDAFHKFSNSSIDMIITGDVKHAVFHDAYCASKSVVEILHYEEFEALRNVLDDFDVEVKLFDKNYCQII